MSRSRKQRIRERNEALRRKWSTEEHRERLEKTQEYLKSIGSVMIKPVKPVVMSNFAKTHQYTQHKKVKRKKASKKNIPGIVIPKQYLIQQNMKKKPTNGDNGQSRKQLDVVKENAAIGISKKSKPVERIDGKQDIIHHKVEGKSTMLQRIEMHGEPIRRINRKQNLIHHKVEKKSTIRRKNKKQSIVHHMIVENKYPEVNNKDYYDFAGEYEARNIEYGHGRKRNREWNDQLALGLNDELAELKRLRDEGWID